MSRSVTVEDNKQGRQIRVELRKFHDGPPQLYSLVLDGEEFGVEIGDLYKIRNMINSELDDAYVPVVSDPEDAA